MPSKPVLRDLAGTVYLAAIIATGAVVIIASTRELVTSSVGLPWFILAALTALSGMATLRLPNVPASFSISDSFTITAALLFGPAAGAIVVAIDSLVISAQLARRAFRLQRLLFNVAAPALAMWVAARGFFAITGVNPLIMRGAPLGSLFVPIVAFTALYFLLNTGLIAGAIAFEQRTGPVTIWRRHLAGLWLAHFGGASVAVLLIALVHSQGANLVALALVAPIPLILYGMFKTALGRVEDQLAHVEHVNQMQQATIETLAHAIDAKDQVTHGHIRRVQRRAMKLAAALGIDDERERHALEAAALLHDLGKLAVPEHILNKPGRLTATEFEKMKEHTSIGAEILSAIDFPYPVVPIVRHHHENWDGTGYPSGLKREEIPIGARILAVVDCFDALTSDRPYRPRMTAAEAITILQDRSGVMYDPRIVAKFLEIQAQEPPDAEAAPAPAAFSAIAETVQSDAARRWGDVGAPIDTVLVGTMYDLGAAVAADAETLAERLHHALAQMMPATCTVIYVHDAARDEMVPQHVAGRYAAAVRGIVIPFGQRLTGWVAAHRSTIVNSDAALDLGSLTIELHPVPRSCMSTVLCVEDEVVGAVTIYSTSLEPFTERHVALLQVLAPRLAVCVRSTSFRRAPAPQGTLQLVATAARATRTN